MSAFRLADQLVDMISNGCEPQVPVSSEIAAADSKTVIVLSFQMGLHCPYHVKSSGVEDGTFVRVGATSRPADEDSLKELEIIGRGRCFDSMACRGLDVSQAEINRLCAKMYRLECANCDDDAERRKIRKVTEAQLEDLGVLVRSGIPRIQELLQKAGLLPLRVENSGTASRRPHRVSGGAWQCLH